MAWYLIKCIIRTYIIYKYWKLNKGTNKFRKERNKNYLLNYSADEIDMSSLEKSSSANKISLVYSSGTKVYYEYDESNKYYLRSTEIGPHTDYVTKQQYHFKNIIAYQVDNYTINDGENKGRQDIKILVLVVVITLVMAIWYQSSGKKTAVVVKQNIHMKMALNLKLMMEIHLFK